MANKLYDLGVPVAKYTVNGQEKTRWENIGSVMKGDNGPYIILKATFNPAAITRKDGADSIVISCFKPKEQTQPQQQFSGDTHDFSFGTQSQNITECPF